MCFVCVDTAYDDGKRSRNRDRKGGSAQRKKSDTLNWRTASDNDLPPVGRGKNKRKQKPRKGSDQLQWRSNKEW